MNRVFLVGCPRSGTTLLQSLLASSSHVVSFPETHFFVNLLPYRPLYQKMGIASRRARIRLEEFLSDIDRRDMLSQLPAGMLFVSQYVNGFVAILDSIAREGGADGWLEKTPGHLHFIPLIEGHIPGVKFIHLIRNGADVVASLYDVTHKYPNEWHGAWSLDDCIHRWEGDVRRSLVYLEHANHILVRYEALVRDARETLVRLCHLLNIPFEEEMLARRGLVVDELVSHKENWKREVREPIHSTQGEKFNTMFDDDQKIYILGQLKDLDAELARKVPVL
jgi:hypothetical protein